MSFFDKLKEDFQQAITKLRETYEFHKDIDLLIEQLPTERDLENYYYDPARNAWILKSQVSAVEVPILDENQSLIVNQANYRKFSGVVIAGQILTFYEDLVGFLADSITICVMKCGNINDSIDISYQDVNDQQNAIHIYHKICSTTFIEQVDIEPYQNFVILLNSNIGLGFQYEIIFSKQKKTKISDEVYGASWNGIKNYGASKDSLFDKIESLTLIGLFEKNHASLTNVLTSQHHVKTVSSDISLAFLAEKNHASLAGVLTSQHHVKTVSSDISLASLAEKLHASLAGVSASQHHVKTVSSEILLASMGEKSYNSLTDKPTDFTAFNAIGSANKQWKGLVWRGHYNATNTAQFVNQLVRNLNATDTQFSYNIPLTPNKSTYSLKIDTLSVYLLNADTNDRILSVNIFGVKNDGTTSTLYTSALVKQTVGQHTWDLADIDCNGYTVITVVFACQFTTAYQFSLTNQAIEYYYS